MADNAPIAIDDGESTPVTHTMSPKGIYGDLAKYHNLATSYVEGREQLSLQSKEAGKSAVRRVETVLHIPRVLDETINGVSQKRVADYMQVRTTYLVPTSWEEQDIENGRVMNSNLCVATAVANAVDKGEFVY